MFYFQAKKKKKTKKKFELRSKKNCNRASDKPTDSQKKKKIYSKYTASPTDYKSSKPKKKKKKEGKPNILKSETNKQPNTNRC